MPTQRSSTPAGRAPVFILTASRSGSTLLRFILDSHPDLACPPETSIATAAAQLARSWSVLGGAADGHLASDAALDDDALEGVRESVDHAYGHYLRRRGKQRWCDKSLDNHQVADLLIQLYPDARFVCLFRHCMDVIASGVETCPWGLHRFGFDSFAAQNPGNSVAAIGSYWLATAQAILAFAEQHPDSCHRIRYEDLVSEPEQVAAGLLSFLGATPLPGITRQSFNSAHEGDGPGDEKIWFTSEVRDDSLGRGRTVPAKALPPSLREAINETLAHLDYRPVDDQWNAAIGRVDPRLDAPAGTPAWPGGPAGAEVTAIAHAISAAIGSRDETELRQIGRRWPALRDQTVAIVVEGTGGEHADQRWTFAADGVRLAPRLGDGEEEPAATIVADAATWRSLLDGKANMITEITAGRLRCSNRRDVHRLRSDEVHAVATLLGFASIPTALARTAPPVPVPAAV